MRYPFVLFDVGETLVGPSESFGAVYASVVSSLGLDIPADRAEASLRQVWREMERTVPEGTDRYAYFPGGEDGYWLRFARSTLEKACGTRLDDAFLGRALERLREAFRDREAWVVYPDVLPALGSLHEDGVRLGIVSNWDSRLPDVLELLGLAGYFEQVGVSHLEGVEKPAPAFFRRVLGRMGGRPDQALHVGDVPELDLAGARAAGLDAVLIDRRGRLDPALGALRDLTSLPGIVRGELPPRSSTYHARPRLL